MSPSDNNPPPLVSRGANKPPADPQAAAKLAHELANLVDGSLRNVSLAMSRLRDTSADADAAEPGASPPGNTSAVTPVTGDTVRRLEAANDALRQMARLIHAWMGDKQPTGAFRYDDQSFGDVIEQVIRLLSPLAAQHDIELRPAVADEALRLPAGPIYALLANAVRNSIEAIAASGQTGRIEILGAVVGDQIELTVRDNGPGLPAALVDELGQFRFGTTTKASGHGLGLVICREIAARLDGALEFDNRIPPSIGAALTVRYPISSVVK